MRRRYLGELRSKIRRYTLSGLTEPESQIQRLLLPSSALVRHSSSLLSITVLFCALISLLFESSDGLGVAGVSSGSGPQAGIWNVGLCRICRVCLWSLGLDDGLDKTEGFAVCSLGILRVEEGEQKMKSSEPHQGTAIID